MTALSVRPVRNFRRRRWLRRVGRLMTRSLHEAAVMLAIASGGIAFALLVLHHSGLRGS